MLTSQRSSHAHEIVSEDEPGDLASSLKELAQVYQSHQRYEDAKLLCRKALALEKLFLGRMHPQVAITTAALAGIHQEEGDLGQASLLYKQALLIAERSVSANHLLLSSIMVDLSDCYSKQGLYGEARSLSKRAEKLRKQVAALKS